MNAYPQLYNIAEERFSCRSYLSTPVDPDALLAVMDLVRLAPSACNRQPWMFIIADTPEDREAVISSYPREWIKTAPEFIIACADHNESWKRPQDGKDHADIDVAIAVEHLCLAATTLGLSTCWVCHFDPSALRMAFNLPDHLEPVAIIPIGYAAPDEAVPSKTRKPIDKNSTEENSEHPKNKLRTLPIILSLAVTAVIISLSGCSTTGCTENRNSIPIAGFYSYSTLDPITVDSVAIGGVGAPADSLLLRPSTRGSQVYLPFRASSTETSFYIRYLSKDLDYPDLYDTLTFTYTSVPYFASADCGAMYHYNITGLDHTNHLIDSVGVIDSIITNLERETIRIFFRTSDPEDTEETESTDEITDENQ